ncbi:MAG: hypothetical protein IKN72_09150 [Clostridia bacterium]|nr:hypothetical protein [Clostridia bacterium]
MGFVSSLPALSRRKFFSPPQAPIIDWRKEEHFAAPFSAAASVGAFAAQRLPLATRTQWAASICKQQI